MIDERVLQGDEPNDMVTISVSPRLGGVSDFFSERIKAFHGGMFRCCVACISLICLSASSRFSVLVFMGTSNAALPPLPIATTRGWRLWRRRSRVFVALDPPPTSHRRFVG